MDRLGELIEKLQSSDKNVVKASIVEDLGNLDDPRAVRPLIKALNDSEMLVRWNAIKALARFGEGAVAPLLNALNDTDHFKRRNVVQALGEVGGDESVDRLIRMLMFDESDQNVLVEVIRSLDKICDRRAVEPLITVLKMNNWEMRWRAIHALERLEDPRAIEPLLDAVNDSDKDIKWAAYKAIERIKSAAAQAGAEPPEAAAAPPKPVSRQAAQQRKADVNLSVDALADHVLVHVDGELFSGNIESFTGFINGVMAVHRTGPVTVDMKSCTFIDSFALSQLNILRKRLKSRNRPLILSGLRPNVKTVFTATKLDQLFQIV